MDSSDDEGETHPESVSTYSFLDHEDEPISFSVVPCLWSESEKPDRGKETVFLHGSADNGLKTIYKEIKAWKFDLSNVKPEISVLSKDNNWFKLESPRKSYEGTVRTVLITVHSLHYLKRNPDASGKTLWDNLAKVFRSYEVRPSPKDLADQTSLITEAIERDDSLGKIKFLTTFLEEKSSMKKLSGEDVREGAKPSFIVEDDADVIEEDIKDNSESEDEDEGDVFDSVCAICDNGGELLCCEGRCMRSFHATTRAGEDSLCESLGYSEKQVEAIENFVCSNCKLKQHQCFVCGKLGSSDKFSGAEVFACVSATCGRFYHPRCVATLLHSKDEAAAKELQKDIAEGKNFICPSHKCSTCNQGENKSVPELQFAVCRRCPLSYHRKCLPKGIKFEDAENEDEDEDDDEVTRAWEGLLPDRILIYCLNHDIDAELGTPVRNHIKFPDVEEKKTPAVDRKKKPAAESSLSSRKAKMASPALNVSSGRNPSKALGEKRKLVSGGKEEAPKTKKTKVSSEQESAPRKAVKTGESQRLSSVKKSEKTKEQPRTNYTARTKETTESDQEELPEKQDGISGSKEERNKSSSSLPVLSAAAERRILNILKDAKSNVTMKDVLKKHKAPCSSSQSLKSYVDKTITMGKLEGAIQAARAALQKLEEGGDIEDAKAVCGPDVLNQINKWKDKLKVYVAPFVFGSRYTSYGRHFTKKDKLQEIVDRIHWYVQDGDTVVDFCCGANEFSCLMAKKMEETGKNCSYKNYDIFPAKNDFNFEKKDWLTVTPGELPPGNKLIMGLNPPFGVKSALANKFVDKALEFKPKLLILIVPSETQMLNKKKKSQYELVWQDDRYLSGKSFYLPGSTGENDKQMVEQWNVSPPRIYLWSRQDWLSKHKDIAQKQGHLDQTRQEENHHSISNEVENEQNDEDLQMVVVSSPKSPMAEVAESDEEDDAGVDYAAAIDGILEEINQECDKNDTFDEGTSSSSYHHLRLHDQDQQENQKRKKNEEEAVSDENEAEKLWRDLDARTSVLLYGRQEPEPPAQRSGYSPVVPGPTYGRLNPGPEPGPTYGRLNPGPEPGPAYGRLNPGPEPGPTYGRLNMGAEPVYQMTTTMRYAPRLDEMNHQPRSSAVGVRPQGVMGRVGFYEPGSQGLLLPPHGFASGPHRYPGSQGLLPPPHGFASGPHRASLPGSDSSGWIE